MLKEQETSIQLYIWLCSEQNNLEVSESVNCVLTQMRDNGTWSDGAWHLTLSSVMLPSNPGNEETPPMIFSSLSLQMWTSA